MNIYEILGVDASAEPREIKRAYAQRLKQCDPAKEPERFQALRAAYEQALAWAQARARAEASNEVTTESPIEEAPQVIAMPPEVTPQREAPPVSAEVVAPEEAKEEQDEVARSQPEAPAIPEVADTPMALADAALTQLIGHYAKREAMADAGIVLDRFLDSLSLDSLEAMEHFEQMLLGWIFSPPVKIDMLDAANERFRWETANRHLHHWRSDLAWRLKRHMDLRVAIASLGADGDLLIAAMNWHNKHTSPRPPFLTLGRLASLSDMLDRLRPAFANEMEERFGEAPAYFLRMIESRVHEIRKFQGRAEIAQGNTKADLQSLWIVQIFMAISRWPEGSFEPKRHPFLTALLVIWITVAVGAGFLRPVPPASSNSQPSVGMQRQPSLQCEVSDEELLRRADQREPVTSLSQACVNRVAILHIQEHLRLNSLRNSARDEIARPSEK
jgi:hypothetical protein